jgi:hypothetical protein
MSDPSTESTILLLLRHGEVASRRGDVLVTEEQAGTHPWFSE